jgi:hypothetical protein
MQPPAGNTGCGVGADLAFDQPLKGGSVRAGEDKCQLRALVRALDIHWPVGPEDLQNFACGPA